MFELGRRRYSSCVVRHFIPLANWLLPGVCFGDVVFELSLGPPGVSLQPSTRSHVSFRVGSSTYSLPSFLGVSLISCSARELVCTAYLRSLAGCLVPYLMTPATSRPSQRLLLFSGPALAPWYAIPSSAHVNAVSCPVRVPSSTLWWVFVGSDASRGTRNDDHAAEQCGTNSIGRDIAVE